MPIINRTVEVYNDGLNVSIFMHGDKPVANILVDEEKGVIYKCFGKNAFEEKMFIKIPIDNF